MGLPPRALRRGERMHRRQSSTRLLLAGDTTVEDGLGTIHYCRLTKKLRVVCDEGGRARSRATEPRTIVRAVPHGSGLTR